jgi:hypothetical protein
VAGSFRQCKFYSTADSWICWFILHLKLFPTTTPKALSAMGPPQPLVDNFRWAHESVAWMKMHAKSTWFFETRDLPLSSWFSGYGCSELAAGFLNAARRRVAGEDEKDSDAFSAAHQFEINVKARTAAKEQLPEHSCQFVDIMRILNDDDRKKLLKMEKDETKGEKDFWDFLKTVDLSTHSLCAKHCERPRGPYWFGWESRKNKQFIYMGPAAFTHYIYMYIYK